MAAARPKLFGMVSTRHSEDYTLLALETFFAETPLGQFDQFILIDNDGTLDQAALQQRFEQAVLRTNDEPRSFAANANTLMRLASEAKADLLLLNNDIVFTSGWLDAVNLPQAAITIPLSNLHLKLEHHSFTAGASVTLEEYELRKAELEQALVEHKKTRRGYQQVLFSGFYCARIPFEVYSAVGEFDERFSPGGGEDGDYALRTALAGYPLLIAADSWLLHFSGRSTYHGPETPADTAARNDNYRRLFREKWGELLTRLVLFHDAAVIDSNKQLKMLAQQRRFRSMVMALAGPRLDRSSLWQPRVASLICLWGFEPWLEFACASAYPVCEKVFFLIAAKPWNGAGASPPPALEQVTGLQDPGKKIEIVRGNWKSEAAQRNFGLRLLQERGFDYCLVQDADEVYNTGQLKNFIALAAEHRQVRSWRTRLYTYWKSERYRIEPPENLAPVVLIRPGEARFTERRTVDDPHTKLVPPELLILHHLSYARSDDELQQKISSFSHAREVVPGWYENVWCEWNKNPRLENLHPTHPGAYKAAVPVRDEDLPPLLRLSAGDNASAAAAPLFSASARALLTSSGRWPAQSIAYYCGSAAEPWDETSPERGIGGAESAVVRLSRLWAKEGYKVTVFGLPQREHVDDAGVQWKMHWRFELHDYFDVLIAWRSRKFFQLPVRARFAALDSHDALFHSDFSPESLARINCIFVKSFYHRRQLPGLGDGKFAVIPNGFADQGLETLNGTPRAAGRLLYASCYDRGLGPMLQWGWPLIRQAVPQAELHIYYGWEVFDRLAQTDPARAAMKEPLLELMKQDGVYEHGRVGQTELMHERARSELHYYGCTATEVDCISVRESAAAGCIPVATFAGGLAEKQYVLKVPGDPRTRETQQGLAKKIVELLSSPKDVLDPLRQAGMEQARKETWEETARRWLGEFEK